MLLYFVIVALLLAIAVLTIANGILLFFVFRALIKLVRSHYQYVAVPIGAELALQID